MQRDLVERRGWVSEQDYKEGLSLAQLAPGPLAAQLAIYLGWVRAGILGATLVSLAFVGPSLVMVLALSAAYVRFGGLPWMQGVFYGVGAAVIAIIAQGAIKLTRLTLGRDRFLWFVFGLSALVTGWTESEIFSLFVAAGVATMLVRRAASSRGWAAVILPTRAGSAVLYRSRPPLAFSGTYSLTSGRHRWWSSEAGSPSSHFCTAEQFSSSTG